MPNYSDIDIHAGPQPPAVAKNGDIWVNPATGVVNTVSNGGWGVSIVTDANLVHFDRNETITGIKTFTASPVLANGVGIDGKDTAGTVGHVIQDGVDDIVRVGWQNATATNGHLILYAGGKEVSRWTPNATIWTLDKIGSGDDVSYYATSTPFIIDARQGTAASPVIVGTGPTFKLSRTESIPATSMPAGNGANNQGNAGILVSSTGDANNQAQVSAGFFTSQNASTQTRTANAVNIDA